MGTDKISELLGIEQKPRTPADAVVIDVEPDEFDLVEKPPGEIEEYTETDSKNQTDAEQALVDTMKVGQTIVAELGTVFANVISSSGMLPNAQELNSVAKIFETQAKLAKELASIENKKRDREFKDFQANKKIKHTAKGPSSVTINQGNTVNNTVALTRGEIIALAKKGNGDK